jgi:signal transduction histidine kinase
VTATAEDLAAGSGPNATRVVGHPSALGLAIWTAIAVTVLNAAILAIDPGQTGLVALLVAVAGLCVAVLAVRRAPSLAWLAAIVASYEASTIVFARARDLKPDVVGLEAWLGTALAVAVCAIATAWIAAGYATRPGRRLDRAAVPVSVALLGWIVFACLLTLVVVLLGQRTVNPAFDWLDVATAPTEYYLPFVAVLTTLGVAADVRFGRDRAHRRLAAAGVSRPDTWAVAVATVRELIPGQAAAEEAALAAERTRLAGDLHASVLPALRRAIADAETGGDPEELARRLRGVDLELERLMADRWPVVLEAFGLVAALEDLAERLEADGAPPITIDVQATGDRAPAAVERAAWRFSQLTVDNAVRHAGATAIGVAVAVERSAVHVAISDDGAGFDPLGPNRPAARGLADATRAASEVGAAVEIGRGPERGTTAVFDWRRSA